VGGRPAAAGPVVGGGGGGGGLCLGVGIKLEPVETLHGVKG